MSSLSRPVYHRPMMKLPRLLIVSMAAVLGLTLVTACGNGMALEVPTPTVTRMPVQAPTAPAIPTGMSTSDAFEEPTATEPPTEAPPTETATEPPAGQLEPLERPTESTVEQAAPPVAETPEPPAAQSNEALSSASVTDAGAVFQFSPGELVQGGSAIVYFNEAATAATMTFGGKQYPMLFDGARWWAIVGIGAFSEPGIAPITVTYQPAGGGDQAVATGSIPIVDRAYAIEDIELDEETSALLEPSVVNNEEALRATIFAGYTTQRLWDGPFLRPADSAVTSTYGIARSYNGGPVTSYHRGTDFAGGDGDPAYAAAAGRVVFADTLRVRGNSVIIDHGVGVYTAYSHLSQLNVSEGQMVAAGDLIGLIGSTGLVTGPHLHWEVIVRGIEVDGELWLAGVGQ